MTHIFTYFYVILSIKMFELTYLSETCQEYIEEIEQMTG